MRSKTTRSSKARVAAKSARLNLRVQPALKSQLEEAARASGQTLTEFCLAAVRQAANAQLRDAQTIRLRGRDAEIFLNALLRPPKPHRALIRAARQYRDRVVSD